MENNKSFISTNIPLSFEDLKNVGNLEIKSKFNTVYEVMDIGINGITFCMPNSLSSMTYHSSYEILASYEYEWKPVNSEKWNTCYRERKYNDITN